MDHIVLACDRITIAKELIRTEIPTTKLTRDLAERGRAHWAELHTCTDATPEWLAEWESRIPRYSCDCHAKYQSLKAAYPPRFGADWFEWTWVIHNAVRRSLDRPEISLSNARACWLGPVRHHCGPYRDRLLITVATGRTHEDILAVTRPSLVAYAAKCDADYIELTNTTADWWGYEKFRVYEFARKYAQTLYVDADIWIKSECPDLFSLDCVAMHDDRVALEAIPTGLDWAKPEFDAILRSQQILPRPVGRIWNTGVVLCTRDTADIWQAPEHPLPTSHCAEQWWVTQRCDEHSYHVQPLDRRFNNQWWMPDFAERVDDAYIVHWANAPDKARTIREWISGLR
jgi:hypothetical protein